MRASRRRVVDASRSTAFRVLERLDEHPRWNPLVARVDRRAERASYDVLLRPPGMSREVEAVAEVVAREAPLRLEIAFASGSSRVKVGWSLRRVEVGTEVTAELEVPGVPRLLAPVVAVRARMHLDAGLGALAARVVA